MISNFTLRFLLGLLVLFGLSGCFVLGQNSKYQGPPPRPPEIEEVYSYKTPYKLVSEEVLRNESEYEVKLIQLETEAGEAKVEFYQSRPGSKELIFVFPVLGGRPILSRHFASYFAKNGFDAAIVHRSNEFKKPENFHKLEELFQQGVVRDRNAIDYFEKEQGKTKFATFGMSRGGINVGMTAGIDARLEYNVIAMAGADLPDIFLRSHERRIARYFKTIQEQESMSREEVFNYLRKEIKTDPKYFAKYIDSRKTLMMLALCDTAVPLKNGNLLRDLIGQPRTIYTFSGHKTSVLFAQVIPVLPPFEAICAFPPDYIESEALIFFRDAFGRGRYPYHIIPLKILQLPLNGIFQLIDWIVD